MSNLSNLPELARTCLNLPELAWTCLNLFKLVQTCPNLSKLVQTCPNLSDIVWFKVLQIFLQHLHWSFIFSQQIWKIISTKYYNLIFIIGKFIWHISLQRGWRHQWTNPKCCFHVPASSLERDWKSSCWFDWKPLAGK